MSYALGFIAGLALGGIAGQLKNLFLWRRYLQKSASKTAGPEGVGGLYGRALISYFVNILVLTAAFLLRNTFPFNGIAFLIGTAVALATMNKVLSLQQKRQEDRRKESGQ